MPEVAMTPFGALVIHAHGHGRAEDSPEQQESKSFAQWIIDDDGAYLPAPATTARIVPGYYEIKYNPSQGAFFLPVKERDHDLLKFPNSAAAKVLDSITDFWAREELFRQRKLAYKRGVLLYGPPGSGKTSALEMASRDVIDRGGIVVTFPPEGVDLFMMGYRALREIHPDLPLIVLMEDLDELLHRNNQSRMLNMLDGVEMLDRVIFLATTNYPEKLQARVTNRPSRFDVRIEVPAPNANDRRLYLQSLLQEGDDIDLERFVRDSADLSLAHVKELFLSVQVLGADYAESVDRLKKMSAVIKAAADLEVEMPGGYI